MGLGAALFLYWGAAVDAAIVQRHETISSIPLWIFLGAMFALSIATRVSYFAGFKIPSGGMLPTLAIGDHFMVAKWRKQPARGGLVVFVYPVDTSKDFVQRVVALPNDRVEVRQGTLYVNGSPATDGPGESCTLWDYDELRDTWMQKQATCVPESA